MLEQAPPTRRGLAFVRQAWRVCGAGAAGGRWFASSIENFGVGDSYNNGQASYMICLQPFENM
jgi:hypothetical protein